MSFKEATSSVAPVVSSGPKTIREMVIDDVFQGGCDGFLRTQLHSQIQRRTLANKCLKGVRKPRVWHGDLVFPLIRQAIELLLRQDNRPEDTYSQAELHPMFTD